MVEAMKPGSVVVDLAAEQGGNCELTEARQDRRDARTASDRRLHRHAEPDGDAGLDALRQQHPPHAGRPDARPRTACRSSTWRTTSSAAPRSTHQRRRHLPAAAAKDRARSPSRRRSPRLPAETRRAEGRRASSRELPKALEPHHGAPRRRHRADAPRRHRGAGRASCSTSSSSRWPASSASTSIWNVSHALHTPLMAITNGISSIIILGGAPADRLGQRLPWRCSRRSRR